MAQIKNAQNLYSGNKTHALSQGKHYSKLASELKRHQGIVVGVLQDLAYTGHETPADLRFEHFLNTWGAIPGVLVVPLDANQIRSYSILFQGKMDVLVFPYGSIFPMDALNLYSAQTFNQFLKRGGAVLTTGGIPFMKQSSPQGDFISIKTPEEMTEVYDKWVSKFGIKYYECSIPPKRQRVNRRLLPSMPDTLEGVVSRYGVSVANSAHEPVPKPPHGNVFPERYPMRQVIPLLEGVNKYGTHISTSALLTQDYEDGSRRIHFTHEDELHPLSPSSGYFEELMKDLFYLLDNRIIASDIEPEYACYRQGEEVRIRTEIINHGSAKVKDVVICLEIEDTSGGIIYSDNQRITLEYGMNDFPWFWKPDRFEVDEYIIRVLLVHNGRPVSQAENGFVIWNAEKLQSLPSFGIHQHYFTVGGKGTFIMGTNYYESTRGELMWFRPNSANLIRDFRQMHDSGVNMIRPHYHHLKWFKDYLTYHHGRLFPFFKELGNCDSYMPDERVWRIWDLFIYLSHKYGIVYNGDLFTLVPEEMGDPRGWFGTVEAVYDREKRSAQKKFLIALEQRYRELPGISWDLFNEPYTIPDEAVGEWVQDLYSVLEALNPERLITVGGPFDMGKCIHYDSPHGMLSEDFVNTRNRPILLQEVHLDQPEPLASEIKQAQDLRRAVVSALRSGLAGICPWSWTRQMRLWQDTYEHHHTFPMEKWDDRLGLHTHEDGTFKLAGEVFKDIAILLRGIDFIHYDEKESFIVTSRGQLLAKLDGLNGHRGNTITHMNRKNIFAAMAFEKVSIFDRCLIEGQAGSYLFICAGENDFDTAKEIYLKTDVAGSLLLYRIGVQSVEVVDRSSCGEKRLSEAFFTENNGVTAISVEPEACKYWFRVRLKDMQLSGHTCT
ncbi:MAG TPA: hypothetical protein VGE40_10855 [Bacilli bacterium]